MTRSFRKRSNRQRCKSRTITYSVLEPRQLLAGISLETVNGYATVVIDGSNAHDVSEVQNLGSSIRVTLNDQQQIFATSAVERIRFLGRNGNDSFTNYTQISSSAYGHAGNDILRGGNGNNWIQGGAGNDLIVGGDRNDLLRGRGGDDVIDPGARHDRVFGGDGNDTVIGSDGNDIIHGENGDDTLRGGDGRDQIFGGTGNDFIEGGSGDDELWGGAGHDQIFGQQGSDILRGSDGNDALYGGIGNDLLFGDAGNDQIWGDAGQDQLFGGPGSDSLNGGAGNDTIDFGLGGEEFAIFQGEFGDYNITASGQTLNIASHSASEGTDSISRADTLRFSNVDLTASNFFVNLNVAEQHSLQLLNQLRQSLGRSPLTAVVDLSNYAETWSQNVLPVDFHHSTAEDVAPLIVDGRTLYGENIIFYGDSSLTAAEAAQFFHDTWLDSPSHFQNMIDSRWTEVGIGLVKLASGWYGTHSFSNS